MKKIFTLFFLLTIPIALTAQWFGDGLTAGSAYYGTINSTSPMVSWNTANFPGGVIYVGRSTIGQEDLTVSTGGTLTIEQGITVRFCSTLTDLIITGTGELHASSGTQNGIIFTRNIQASWGHISFQSMGAAGLSTINNCVIEFGNVSTAPGVDNPYHYGGAIHTDFSNLVVSNCEMRNNRAGWGGAIFIGDGRNPTITNCYIHDNIATTSGGGVYFWKNSFSSFFNNIITYNNCSGAGGGGGIFVGGTAKNIRVVNCVISHNTAVNQTLGHNIKIFNNTASPKPQFINSIIWFPANSISYVSSTPNTLDFVNCAIQDPPSTYTNCITLNASNTGLNPSGPFFANMSGSNWDLQGMSPCRDAGISSGAPLTDYLGNGRVGPYDIGAYELQYCRWNGSISDVWGTTNNWDGNVDPNSGSFDVIIPSGLTNYPTGDPSAGYVIPLNRTMILNPGAKATFASLRNNGSLILQSDATGISSLILNTNVTATVELFLTGGNPGAPLLKLNKWHYISTPVSSLPVSTFAPTYTQNVVGYYDNQVSGTMSTGWVAYDGYRYSTGGMGGPTFSSLIPGIGYDYYAAADHKYTFSGNLNFSDIPVSLSYSVNDALHGYNLLGNPFSSGLNWDDIANDVYYPFPAGTSKALYFTRDNVPCSYINGVGIPADVNGIIPPMQGFFVKTNSAGNMLTIPAAARVQTNIHPRYKKSMEVIPLVRLTLAENTLTDETVIRFDASATINFDNNFDAEKTFLSGDVLSAYSSLGGLNYAVNGIPFPESTIEIPIVVNLVTSGNHTMSASQLEGLENYNVTLTDKSTGFTADLKTTPLITFNGNAGTSADRFVLKVSTITTGVEDPILINELFNIYPGNNLINIQTASDLWDGKSGSVRVIDLTGRTVGTLDNESFSKNSLIQISAPVKKGIYLVELKSGVLRHLGKVIIK